MKANTLVHAWSESFLNLTGNDNLIMYTFDCLNMYNFKKPRDNFIEVNNIEIIFRHKYGF
ncbi:hypothetical protein QP71_10600 [Staphylococcus aureus]|nr:hypothetical protein C9J78_12905 [Staphylococcus aureus]KIT74640.1 hypothetical protein QP71_10600 [Staphylococcus aureus]MCL9701742.1 hypothetical protein [Staphylococcus aureus]